MKTLLLQFTWYWEWGLEILGSVLSTADKLWQLRQGYLQAEPHRAFY